MQEKQQLAQRLKETWDNGPENFPKSLQKFVVKYLPKEQ
jgi:hypothetical protein